MIRYNASRLGIAVQGFTAGAILMAILCNYNRSQMPLAIVCWIISILCDIETD